MSLTKEDLDQLEGLTLESMADILRKSGRYKITQTEQVDDLLEMTTEEKETVPPPLSNSIITRPPVSTASSTPLKQEPVQDIPNRQQLQEPARLIPSLSINASPMPSPLAPLHQQSVFQPGNQSWMGAMYVPKLSIFSGDKDKASFDVFEYEVRSLLRIHSEEMVAEAIRRSVKGEAARIVMRLARRHCNITHSQLL